MKIISFLSMDGNSVKCCDKVILCKSQMIYLLLFTTRKGNMVVASISMDIQLFLMDIYQAIILILTSI